MAEKIDEILAQRQKTHGNFSDMAQTSRLLKQVMKRESYPSVVAEALDMIAHKLARIKHGDYSEKDHWVDIAGYATLVSKWLESEEFTGGANECNNN